MRDTKSVKGMKGFARLLYRAELNARIGRKFAIVAELNLTPVPYA